jgi:hypothetical protein
MKDLPLAIFANHFPLGITKKYTDFDFKILNLASQNNQLPLT